jgi:hypothetical protein
MSVEKLSFLFICDLLVELYVESDDVFNYFLENLTI